MAIRPTARTDVNRSAVLAQLGAQGPASRADLARALGVSPALMTQLTKDLLADGLIVELEHSPSQGGRPARMLGLAASAGRAIGVKVVADHVAFVEVGLDGAVLRSASEPFDATATTLLADLASLLERFIAGGADIRVLGVGVGVPGRRRSPGQRRRRLDPARLEPGPRRRDPATRAQSARHRREQRERARHGRAPVRRRTSARQLPRRHDRYRCGRRHRGRRGRTPRLERRRRRDRAHARARGRPALQLRQHRMPRGDHRRGGPRPRRVAIAASSGRGPGSPHCGPPPTPAMRPRHPSSARRGTCSAAPSPASCRRSIPSSSSCSGRAPRPGRTGRSASSPRSARPCCRCGAGIGVVVESWQDESWAQGAAALVLATPFDSEGVAGDQGRLVRERLVGGLGRVTVATAPVLPPRSTAPPPVAATPRPCVANRSKLRYALTVLAFLLPSADPAHDVRPRADGRGSVDQPHQVEPARTGAVRRLRQLRRTCSPTRDRRRSSCTRCSTSSATCRSSTSAASRSRSRSTSALKGRSFWRGVYFLPVVTSWIVVALVWRWLLNPSTGVVNTVLAFCRHRRPRLVDRPDLGDAVDHPGVGVEGPRVRHGDPAGRPAGDQPGPHRRRPRRRRRLVATPVQRHAAAAQPQHVLRGRHLAHQRLPGLRPGVRDDRAAARAAQRRSSCSRSTT